MERSQIHRVSVADQVASILRQRILKGELRPGMPLQEVPLAASLRRLAQHHAGSHPHSFPLEGLSRAQYFIVVSRFHNFRSKMFRKSITCVRMLEIPAVLTAKTNDADVLPELKNAFEGYEQSGTGSDWVRAVEFDLQFPHFADSLPPQPASGVFLSKADRRAAHGYGAGGSRS